MIPVPTHPARYIALHALIEKARVIIGRLGHLPHVEGLVVDQDAELITQVQHAGRRRIVGCAQGIDAHRAHDLQLPARGLRMEGAAEEPEVVMQTHAVQFDGLPVQDKASVRVKYRFAEAHAAGKAVLTHRYRETVKIRLVRRPAARAEHGHRGPGDPAAAHSQRLRGGLPVRPGQVKADRLPLRRNRLSRNRQLPSCTVLTAGDGVHAVGDKMRAAERIEEDVTENAGARIPPGVWTPVADAHGDLILPCAEMSGQIRIEGRISVAMNAHRRTVDRDLAVHVHTVEAQLTGIVFRALRHAQRAAVQTVRRFVKIVFLSDQPVMGQRNRLPGRLRHLLPRRFGLDLGKQPSVIEANAHPHLLHSARP